MRWKWFQRRDGVVDWLGPATGYPHRSGSSGRPAGPGAVDESTSVLDEPPSALDEPPGETDGLPRAVDGPPGEVDRSAGETDEPPFDVQLAGYVVDFHAQNRCRRCGPDGWCPRAALARAQLIVWRQRRQRFGGERAQR